MYERECVRECEGQTRRNVRRKDTRNVEGRRELSTVDDKNDREGEDILE